MVQRKKVRKKSYTYGLRVSIGVEYMNMSQTLRSISTVAASLPEAYRLNCTRTILPAADVTSASAALSSDSITGEARERGGGAVKVYKPSRASFLKKTRRKISVHLETP